MENPYLSPAAEANSRLAATEAAAPSNVRYAILGVTTLASLLLYLDRICLAEVLSNPSVIKALGLTDAQIGWSLSAFFWSYALGQVPSGWISDRFGARRMLTVYILSWSLFTALTGWAVGFVMLFILRLSVGVAQAGAYPTSGGIVSRWIPLAYRGTASSIVTFGGRLGGAVAPYSTSWLIPLCGWRVAMLLYGLIGAAVAGAFWRLFRNRPAEHPRCNPAELALIAYGRSADPSPNGSAADLSEKTKPVVGAVLRNASMWLMCLSQFTTNVGWVFLVTWLPTYLKNAKGAGESSGLMGTTVLLVGMAGMLLGGRTTDWATRRLGIRWGRSLPLVLSRFVAAGAFLIVPELESAWAATAAFAMVAFATDLGVAGTWAFMQDVGGKYVGAILGWGNMWGNLGAAVSPPLLNWVSAGTGPAGLATRNWNIAFAVCAAGFIVSGLASLGINAAEPVAPNNGE
ncbi:MAG TPA: MFS transporter [Pirellulales bacterium]|nr:MFS transporter [Pirellulales bacterium]